MMKTLSIVAVAGLAAVGAHAQVVPGVFSPEAIEDFETTGGGRTFLSSICGGSVGVTPSSVPFASVNYGDWYDFRFGSPVVPSSGGIFGTIYGFDGFMLDFAGVGGILGFSGWGTDAAAGATSFEFFDMSGSAIGNHSMTLGSGDGTMQSFSFVSPVAIGSIRLSGPETAFDDLAYSTVPTPGVAALLAGAGLFASRRRRA